MARHMAWRENGGRIRRVELPGMHDSLTGDDIRKKFLSLRGIQERQVYLLTVMTEYPLQLVDSGLIAWFDDEKDYLNTSGKLEWLARLKDYSPTSRRAFDKLSERQQKLILMVFAEKQNIEKAASALRISRKRGNELYREAVLTVFPEYKNRLPPVRELREQLAALMEPETSSREQSGYSEDYLDHLASERASGKRGHDQSEQEGDGEPDADWQ